MRLTGKNLLDKGNSQCKRPRMETEAQQGKMWSVGVLHHGRRQ